MTKIPPQNIEIEQKILGALLLEKDAIFEISDTLKAECFYKEEHKHIFTAIADLTNEGKPVDILTVTDYLRKAEQLEMVGGRLYISELTDGVGSSANIQYHSQLVYEAFLKRELIRIGSMAQELGFADNEDAFDSFDQIEQELTDVQTLLSGNQLSHIKTILIDLTKEIDENVKKYNSGEVTGLKTGIIDLDFKLHGMLKKDLILIAARPGMGKTTLMLQMAKIMSGIHKKPGIIFSLEMSKIRLVAKILSNESEVSSDYLFSGKLTDNDHRRINTAIAELEKNSLYIDETPGLSINELKLRAKKAKQRHKIEFIFVDYLQLLSFETGRGRNMNREQEISNISRGLKNIAKELDLPVIALSQLSRETEKRSNKEPLLSDLRDSGSLEQDADRVIFIHRPAYYDETADKQRTELIVAKNRHGATCRIGLQFEGQISKFKTDTGGVRSDEPF
jgi:replicative DNA helicase